MTHFAYTRIREGWRWLGEASSNCSTCISTRTPRNIHFLFKLLLFVDINSRLPVATESGSETNAFPLEQVVKARAHWLGNLTMALGPFHLAEARAFLNDAEIGYAEMNPHIMEQNLTKGTASMKAGSRRLRASALNKPYRSSRCR